MIVPTPNRGSDIYEWARRVARYLQAITPQTSASVQVKITSGGTSFVANPPVAAAPEAAAVYRFFQLVATKDESDEDVIRVVRSTIDGTEPDTWEGSTWHEADDPPYLLPLVGEAGFVFAHVVVGQAEGEGDITARTVEIAATMPESTDTDHYFELGSYLYEVPEGAEPGADPVLTVGNSAYGPLAVTICRLWYAGESPYWGVTITSSSY